MKPAAKGPQSCSTTASSNAFEYHNRDEAIRKTKQHTSSTAC
jgi:hypothetical protein